MQRNIDGDTLSKDNHENIPRGCHNQRSQPSSDSKRMSSKRWNYKTWTQALTRRPAHWPASSSPSEAITMLNRPKLFFEGSSCGQQRLREKKHCLVSRNPTDPNFLGPTLIFWGHLRTFSSILRVFLMIFMLFVYKKKSKKKIAYLLSLKNIEMFLETRQKFFFGLTRFI